MAGTVERLRLLLVEDSDEDAERLLRELKRSGFELSLCRVQTAEALASALSEPFDLVLCDDAVPMLAAPSVLEAVRKSSADVPFVVVSGTIGEEAAVEAMRGGASDYLLKGNLTRLGPAVARVLSDRRARAEQRRAEVATQQAEAIEMERMAAIGLLASGIGHEISNPLACILANLEFVTDELEMLVAELPSEAAIRLASRIAELSSALADTSEGAERVRAIVQDLRTFSGDASGDTLASIDVRELLDSCLRLTAVTLRQRATIVKDYAAVPRVVANESRLGQVFLSLLVSAAQALPERSPAEHRLEIGARFEGDMVTVTIAAVGGDLSKDALSTFEPSVATKSVGRGTTLGLGICQSIVTQLGGDIAQTGEPGLRFVTRLPPHASPA